MAVYERLVLQAAKNWSICEHRTNCPALQYIYKMYYVVAFNECNARTDDPHETNRIQLCQERDNPETKGSHRLREAIGLRP